MANCLGCRWLGAFEFPMQNRWLRVARRVEDPRWGCGSDVTGFFAIFHLQDMGISYGKSTSKILDPVIFVQKKTERAISRDQLWTVMDSIQNKCPMFREASARGAPPGDPNKERLLYMLTCQELSWCYCFSWMLLVLSSDCFRFCCLSWTTVGLSTDALVFWSGTVREIDWTIPLFHSGWLMEKHDPDFGTTGSAWRFLEAWLATLWRWSWTMARSGRGTSTLAPAKATEREADRWVSWESQLNRTLTVDGSIICIIYIYLHMYIYHVYHVYYLHYMYIIYTHILCLYTYYVRYIRIILNYILYIYDNIYIYMIIYIYIYIHI